MPKGKESKDRPAHEVRFSYIKAAIWKNPTDNGIRYNVTFNRSYKEGEEWKSTDSFGRDDLLLVAKAANEAHSWIFAQGREEQDEGKSKPK